MIASASGIRARSCVDDGLVYPTLNHQAVKTTRPAVNHTIHAAAGFDDEGVLIVHTPNQILDAAEINVPHMP